VQVRRRKGQHAERLQLLLDKEDEDEMR
jgi:hypothetical protein